MFLLLLYVTLSYHSSTEVAVLCYHVPSDRKADSSPGFLLVLGTGAADQPERAVLELVLLLLLL